MEELGYYDDRPSHGLGSWRVRRAFMFAVVVFSGGSIAYVLGADLKHRVAETVVEMAYGTITLVTACYVFGAAWQDIRSIQSSRLGRDDYYHRERHSDGRFDRAEYQPRPRRGRIDNPDDEG